MVTHGANTAPYSGAVAAACTVAARVVRVPCVDPDAPDRMANRFRAAACAMVPACPAAVVMPSLETRPGPHSVGIASSAAVHVASVTEAMSSAPEARAVAASTAGLLFGPAVADARSVIRTYLENWLHATASVGEVRSGDTSAATPATLMVMTNVDAATPLATVTVMFVLYQAPGPSADTLRVCSGEPARSFRFRLATAAAGPTTRLRSTGPPPVRQ
jgi:hypothetical protein